MNAFTEQITHYIHTAITEGMKQMHDIQFTMSGLDVLFYLLVCGCTLKLIDDKRSVLFVQVAMLLVAFL